MELSNADVAKHSGPGDYDVSRFDIKPEFIQHPNSVIWGCFPSRVSISVSKPIQVISGLWGLPQVPPHGNHAMFQVVLPALLIFSPYCA